MKTRPLQYYMHDRPSAFRFELSGELDCQGECRLDQDWRTASSTLGGRRLVVDITFLTGGSRSNSHVYSVERSSQ
ncbi:MAG: hypothetical protein DMG57_20775 [Acidobacteria bacterium]|nr:MAG: hypothetical protein DMG57_20775 [Acidobacteriota bacterium]